MARTRSKSNVEASASVSNPTTSTPQVLHSSPLKPSTYPSTIYERSEEDVFSTSRIFPQPKFVSPQRALGRVFNPPEDRPTSSGGHARGSRLAAIKTLEQLRKRLSAIDDHSRELREARHILVRREEALVKERDELVEFLKSLELSILAGSPTYPDRPLAVDKMDTEVDIVGDDDEDEAEMERSAKRKAIADPMADNRPMTRKRASDAGLRINHITRPEPTPLAEASTLIQYCPPELLQPSNSLPRPSENSTIHLPQTPAPSPKSSIKRNGIRFPPGSAPRPPRSRSASPFTQMLPPPVPSSPATPVPKRHYQPIVTDLDLAEYLNSSSTDSSSEEEPTLPSLPLRPSLAPKNNTAYTPNSSYNKAHHTTVPIYLMTSSPPDSWEVTLMGPERTPSPPIGEMRLAWAPRPRPEERRRFLEPERSVPDMTVGAKVGERKEGAIGYGPASRTRARVSSAGGADVKGKGRA
ncbi:hypothetical protein BDV93DRAFT_542708 [Ceratobasidium sp. AG-I]|nr:hypothetical protein BDV93DRAFT_542708 [Ceratobasidium sp. AG-I]